MNVLDFFTIKTTFMRNTAPWVHAHW